MGMMTEYYHYIFTTLVSIERGSATHSLCHQVSLRALYPHEDLFHGKKKRDDATLQSSFSQLFILYQLPCTILFPL